LTGNRLTVAGPFFNKWMAPIALILLFLTGVGPLLAWRKSTVKNLVYQFMWPTIAFVGTAAALAALGIRVWASGICFSLCALVAVTIAQEFIRGANIRKRNTGTDIFTALVGLVGRNKRRYGGYIAHLGFVLILLGFGGMGFNQETQVPLKAGEDVKIGRYTLRNTSLKVSDDGQKQMVTAYLAVFVDGKQIDTLYPAKWFFRKHEQEPTTEVAIRRTLAEDLYVTLGGYEVGAQVANLEIHVNPLVNWVWMGFGILALGTGIALLPERMYSFALARMPIEAASTTALTLLLAILFATPAFAQPGMSGDQNTRTSFYARTDFEKQMQREIVCTCGACGHANIGECRKDACGTSHQMRGELAALIDQGKGHDEIIQAFITKYGSQEMLGAPIDKGFNRLAWLVPYLLGASGAAAIGFAAVKWTRKSDAQEDNVTIDSALEERIDDELRDLD
jgi:cytochrome c-type biogenesis protein CcmF